jgi:hypothetical protein
MFMPRPSLADAGPDIGVGDDAVILQADQNLG